MRDDPDSPSIMFVFPEKPVHSALASEHKVFLSIFTQTYLDYKSTKTKQYLNIF